MLSSSLTSVGGWQDYYRGGKVIPPSSDMAESTPQWCHSQAEAIRQQYNADIGIAVSDTQREFVSMSHTSVNTKARLIAGG